MKPSTKPLEEYPYCLTVRQVQEILGVSRTMAYHVVRRKGFPAIHIGGSIRIRKDRFVEWLTQQADHALAESG